MCKMKIGKGCKISDKISVYGSDRIEIGDNVRIDDFCILSAGPRGYLKIGSHIHIAPYCALFGGSGVVMEDFSTFSSRVTCYSESDDYSGESLVGPIIPKDFKPVYDEGPIYFGKYASIGATCVILPGAYLSEGATVGACSLVRVGQKCEPWGIYAGVPVKFKKSRSKNMIQQADKFLKQWNETK